MKFENIGMDAEKHEEWTLEVLGLFALRPTPTMAGCCWAQGKEKPGHLPHPCLPG